MGRGCGVPAQGVYLPRGVPAQGVYLPGGVPAWGCTCPGGCTCLGAPAGWQVQQYYLALNFAGGKNVCNILEVNGSTCLFSSSFLVLSFCQCCLQVVENSNNWLWLINVNDLFTLIHSHLFQLDIIYWFQTWITFHWLFVQLQIQTKRVVTMLVSLHTQTGSPCLTSHVLNTTACFIYIKCYIHFYHLQSLGQIYIFDALS